MNTSTAAKISGHSRATADRSSDMPTPRKNRPSKIPRKGSTSASNWWRNVDSDNRTPARKAPIAIDRPPNSINSAAPSTTSKAAAVMTSRAWAAANSRNSGFSSQRPAANSARMHPTAIADCVQGSPRSAPPAGASKATSASNGTIARSSSSRIETMRWPCPVALSPRSPRICITMAVDDSTNPIAAMKAAGPDRPANRPTPVSSAPHVNTWATPRPKISPAQLPQARRLHFQPDDEEEHHHAEFCHVQNGFRIREETDPERTNGQARREVAQHGSQPQPLEYRNGDDGRAQQDDDVDELIAFGRQSHVALQVVRRGPAPFSGNPGDWQSGTTAGCRQKKPPRVVAVGRGSVRDQSSRNCIL